MRFGLTLPAIAVLALATGGCGNKLMQPMPGQTPESMNTKTPTYGQAGGPDVGANYPTAAPTASPPVHRDFALYFDTNSATLSPEARSIVQQAAAAARQGPMTHIALTGHTDTVGTAPYNQRLSDRRAAAVRNELIAQGVPANQIVASGVGESQLAVSTAQGVNEPRNRRVVVKEEGPGALSKTPSPATNPALANPAFPSAGSPANAPTPQEQTTKTPGASGANPAFPAAGAPLKP